MTVPSLICQSILAFLSLRTLLGLNFESNPCTSLFLLRTSHLPTLELKWLKLSRHCRHIYLSKVDVDIDVVGRKG
jgi:hypothetical protein